MAKVNLTKRLWVLISIFVGATIVSLVILSNQSKKQMEQQLILQSQREESGGTAPAGGTALQAKTYTQLVTQYKDRRVQFDAMCQAIPNNITYKNGTTVMFDNRSGDARTITIGGLQYYFAGYGYKLITLRSPTLPKTLYLSCGSSVNVGQILLQK